MAFVGLPLLVGAAGAAVSAPSLVSWYASLARPAGTPPNWAFGPVWTVLYVLIGIAAWLVWRARGRAAFDPGEPSRSAKHAVALRLWGWQLLLNAAWAPAFFGLRSPSLALAVMVPLLLMILATIVAFARLRAITAVLLMLPYLLWTCYAAYLTAGFQRLNPAA